MRRRLAVLLVAASLSGCSALFGRGEGCDGPLHAKPFAGVRGEVEALGAIGTARSPEALVFGVPLVLVDFAPSLLIDLVLFFPEIATYEKERVASPQPPEPPRERRVEHGEEKLFTPEGEERLRAQGLDPDELVADAHPALLGIVLEKGSVVVAAIRPDSPGKKAGLRPGDRLVFFDGIGVESFEHFRTLVRTRARGARVKLVAKRGDARVEAFVAIPAS